MISFFSETSFELGDPDATKEWIKKIILLEGFETGDIAYIFCNDEYLHKLNVQFLNHDTLTDVISFDYTLGKQINGEIYISEERVRENAIKFKTDFVDELDRVMAHGVLHFCGYKDKTKEEELVMRKKEDKSLKMR